MYLKSIEEIKNYKSFIHYKWSDFFNSNYFEKINLIFGENGSGKSAIVRILKDLSNNKPFEKNYPTSVIVKTNEKEYKYENGDWDKNISNKSILFFDTDFIKENIHIGNERKSDKDGQEQKSAKLIIEFDKKAIELHKSQKEVKKELDDIKKEIEGYKENNKEILAFLLPKEYKQYYEKYKEYTNDELSTEKERLEKKKNELSDQIKRDEKKLEKTNAIAKISDLQEIHSEISFSSADKYQEIFSYDLKEQVKIDAEEKLIEKIRREQAFFEKGIKLYNQDNTRCPFCQSTKVVDDVLNIIKLYNQIFDDTYKKAKEDFEKRKRNLISELDGIIKISKNTEEEKGDLFIKLKELQQQFSIPNIYHVLEEKQFEKLNVVNIEKLKSKLEQLKKPTNENINDIYNLAEQEINKIKEQIDELNKIIKQKQKIISDFKKNNTNEKISERLKKNREELEQINSIIKFLIGDYVFKQKEKEQKKSDLKRLEEKKENLEEKYKQTKEKYEMYCSSEVFQNTLKKIEEYFNYFNFEFSLELKIQKMGKRREVPFAFKIIDKNGVNRDFTEGLSEGERQILSICFFFAFTDIQENKEEKILVFDDPVTSLDNNNLYNLVNLIYDKSKDFAQVFIFTHHLTFFRYLEKKYKFDKQTKKYLLIRNNKTFGGSFLCGYINKSSFIDKLQNIEQTIKEKAKNPNGIDLQLETIKYGQYLRYEVEKLVKNDLLKWNEQSFSKQIEGIKNNQKLDNDDLETLKKVYDFCNWSNTSHVGYDDQTSFEQLKTKIYDFLKVYNKLKTII